MKRNVIILSVSLLIVSPAWCGLLPHDVVATKVDRGVHYFEQGEFARAAVEFEEVLAASPDDVLATRAAIMFARSEYALEDYDKAVRILEDFPAQYPASTYQDEASYLLGNALFMTGRLVDAAIAYASAASSIRADKRVSDAAMAAYMSVVNQHLPADSLVSLRDRLPDGTPADEVAFAAARAYVDDGRTGPARRALSAYMARFPSGRHVEEARSLANSLAGEPIRESSNLIAVLAPLTGTYAEFGQHVVDGATLAVGALEKQGLSGFALRTYDTQGTTVGAVIRAREVLADRPLAVVGPLLSDEVAGAAAVFAETGIPMIAPAAAQSHVAEIGANVFQLATTTRELGVRFAKYAKERLGLVAMVTIAPDDAFGTEITTGFIEAAKAVGIRVIAAEAYPRGTTDFKKLLVGVQKAQRDSLDAMLASGLIPASIAKGRPKDWWPLVCGVFVPGYGEDLALMLPQLPFYRVYGRILGTSGLDTDQARMQAAEQLEGAVFVADFHMAEDDPYIAGWQDAFRAAFGRNPQRVSAFAYDAAMLLGSAILDGAKTPDEVREALARTTAYRGVTGVIDLSRGRTNSNCTFYEMRSGRARRLPE